MDNRMEDGEIIIESKKYIFIFKVDLRLRKEDLVELRNELMKQINECCVLLPGHVEIVKVLNNDHEEEKER